jgi:hypothetical protein
MRRGVSKLLKAGLILALVFFAAFGLWNVIQSSGVVLERSVGTRMTGEVFRGKSGVSVPNMGMMEAPMADLGVSDYEADYGSRTVVDEPPGGGGSISNRLVVKTGNLAILVKDTLVAVKEVRGLAEGLGGFVLSSRTWYVDMAEERVAGEVTIKVPVDKFEEAMSQVRNLALKVTSEQSSGRDVTEEYTDLQSRLTNLEVAEAQLQELMKRAGKVTEILEVQRELTRVRGNIEQTKGRMKYLEETAAMSTITVSVATEEEELPIVEEKWRPLATVKAALRTLVSFWQNLADRVIYLGIFLAPFVVVGLVGWRVWRSRVPPEERAGKNQGSKSGE